MINILKTEVKKFTNIIHIADCHIRLLKRHDEYKQVFNTFFNDISQYSKENTCIAILGDLFHSKTDLQPECIDLASYFLSGCANLFPTIIIAGNHDGVLVNKNRMDSISPIIDMIAHPNLHYLKANGLYGFGNILWNNMSVFEEPEKYIRGKNIPHIYRNKYDHIVALFHGPVDKSALGNGMFVSNPAIVTQLFDHHHIALLGDLHYAQNLTNSDDEIVIQEAEANDFDMDLWDIVEKMDGNWLRLKRKISPKIRFAGSFIQQNHGEDLHGHGYSLWNLSDYSYKHHELENEVGYFTVEIQQGKLVTDIKNLPKKVRLRIKCFESIASEVKAIVAFIKEKSEVIEIAYVRMDQEIDKKDVIPLCRDIVLTDLTNVNYQNRLIQEFIVNRLKIADDKKINDILDINRSINTSIKRDEFSRNLRWKPIKFEWNNMFTYGENNVIDFTNRSGTYGIFGPNKSGKSSIISAIVFCLYDKFDRGFKGSHVLNAQKTSFSCKLEFDIDGVSYFIERTGSTTRTGNVKVDVRFWTMRDGIEEELHGTARRDTNDIIRDYVGTYEDFLLTTVSFQTAKNYNAFIDMGNSERKDLLVQFIGLNIFDRLHEAANERSKELNTILKLHKDKNYSHELIQNQNEFQQADLLVDETHDEIRDLKKQILDINEEIILETSNLIKLDANVPTTLELLNTRIITAEATIKTKKEAISANREKLTSLEKEVSIINDELKQIEVSDIIESHKTYNTLLAKINEVKQAIDIKKIEIKGKLDKVARLDKHEYDPNCKYCINNSFVKDATNAKKELSTDKKSTDKLMEVLDKYRTEFSKVQWVEQAYERYTKLLTTNSKLKDECTLLSRNIIISINEMDRLNTAYNTIVEQINLYHRNEESVKTNYKVQSKITSYRTASSNIEVELQKQSKLLVEYSGKREVFAAAIKSIQITLNEVANMEYEYDSYQNYLKSVGRDGIPYQVICNTVPEIEKEVNSILNQVVDYTIQFETDGKNIVPYVVYEYGRWPIELTSGYERFVASIAIRVALTEISNLPKTTFLVIDEGFSTLDSEHLADMSLLFSTLKNYYDFIIIISHNETIKDFVDNTIEITHEGNASKVIFE